jgi:hypothetical protein
VHGGRAALAGVDTHRARRSLEGYETRRRIAAEEDGVVVEGDGKRLN